MAKIKEKLDRAEYGKLSAEFQALYVAQGDAYVLDSDGASELRNAFERTKGELADARKRLDALKDIDPAKHAELLDAAQKAEREKELAAGNYQKLMEQDRLAHQAELKKHADLAAALRAQLEDSLVDGELTRAISAYPGARPKLLLPAARSKVALREIGGKQRAVVLDDKGEPRLKPGAKTADEYMAPADLVAEMRNDKEYAGAFPASSTQPLQRSTSLQPDGGVPSGDRAVVESIAQQIRDGVSRLS